MTRKLFERPWYKGPIRGYWVTFSVGDFPSRPQCGPYSTKKEAQKECDRLMEDAVPLMYFAVEFLTPQSTTRTMKAQAKWRKEREAGQRQSAKAAKAGQ